jgi:hypothetical protein
LLAFVEGIFVLGEYGVCLSYTEILFQTGSNRQCQYYNQINTIRAYWVRKGEEGLTGFFVCVCVSSAAAGPVSSCGVEEPRRRPVIQQADGLDCCGAGHVNGVRSPLDLSFNTLVGSIPAERRPALTGRTMSALSALLIQPAAI